MMQKNSLKNKIKAGCFDKYKEYCCSLKEDHNSFHKEKANGKIIASWSQDHLKFKIFNAMDEAYKALDLLAEEFVRTAKNRGFYADDKINPSDEIAKCHEELSELYQVISKGKIHEASDKIRDMDYKMNGKWLTAAQEEAADVIIQNIKIIGRMKEFLGIKSIAEIVKFKNEYNKKREWKHGNE